MTVTGRDIIEEVVERMRTESEPLRYSALAHGVYRVFLHREDYDRLSPARRSLVEEASRALDEELDRLNAHRAPAADQWGKIVQAASRLMKPTEPPLRRPPAGWVIELYPDEDEELLPGHIRITSELGQPPAQAILAGDPTHRVQPLGPSAVKARRASGRAPSRARSPGRRRSIRSSRQPPRRSIRRRRRLRPAPPVPAAGGVRAAATATAGPRRHAADDGGDRHQRADVARLDGRLLGRADVSRQQRPGAQRAAGRRPDPRSGAADAAPRST